VTGDDCTRGNGKWTKILTEIKGAHIGAPVHKKGMNNLQIPQRGIYKEYAGAWEEIEPKDAVYIGKCLYWLENREIDVDMFRKLVVDRLINRVNSKKAPMEGQKAFDLWGNEAKLAETVDFFFKKGKDDKGNETYEIIPEFVTNLLPYVRSGWKKYWGPGYFLDEMSFVEYKDLLYCADKYMKTKDEEFLTRMMAIAYRGKRWFLWILKGLPSFDGRTRTRYVPGSVEFRMKRFSKVDIGAKYIFFQYLMGCVYTLKNDGDGSGIEIDGNLCNFSLVFNRKKSDDDDQEDGVGLTGVIMALAESGVFGKIDETANADVWDVMIRLYQLELQRREMESKMKK
jgi:hypothetical protein